MTMMRPSLKQTLNETLCKPYLGCLEKSQHERGMRKDGEGVDLSAAFPVVLIIGNQCATGAARDRSSR